MKDILLIAIPAACLLSVVVLVLCAVVCGGRADDLLKEMRRRGL